MGVRFDEAGADIAAGGIDDPLTIGGKALADLSDHPVLDPDIGRKSWRAGAINHSAILN